MYLFSKYDYSSFTDFYLLASENMTSFYLRIVCIDFRSSKPSQTSDIVVIILESAVYAVPKTHQLNCQVVHVGCMDALTYVCIIMAQQRQRIQIITGRENAHGELEMYIVNENVKYVIHRVQCDETRIICV